MRSLLMMGAVLFLFLIGVRVAMKLLRGVRLSELPLEMGPRGLVIGLAVLLLLPGLLLAERAARSTGRAVPYTVLVLVGPALTAWLIFFPLDWLGWANPDWWYADIPFQFFVYLDVVVPTGLASFVYATHRERLEAAEAMQAVEKRRNEMLGRIAASRLEAARLRVEPEAFIAELRTIRDTYVEDATAGGARLEAFITRLRAVSRSSAS